MPHDFVDTGIFSVFFFLSSVTLHMLDYVDMFVLIFRIGFLLIEAR